MFKDKPGGLIVDYIGIADNLKKSLAIYTLNTIRDTLLSIDEVLSQLKEKYRTISSLLDGVEYANWRTMPPDELSRLTAFAYDKVSKAEEMKKKFVKNFTALKKLYVLGHPTPRHTN